MASWLSSPLAYDFFRILRRTLDEKGNNVVVTDRFSADATLADIRDETRARYEKLRKQAAYAEEFFDLVHELEP